MKKLNLIYYNLLSLFIKRSIINIQYIEIYLYVSIYIIVYLYYLSLLVSFVKGNMGTVENINVIYNENILDSLYEDILDYESEDIWDYVNENVANNLTNNNLGYFNNLCLIIKNEVINLRNNFVEVFKANNKYTYYTSRVIKDSNIFNNFTLEDNKPIVTCNCAENYKSQLRVIFLEYNMILQNIKSFLNKAN